MKLWQKVFLVSLSLILLAINVTAGIILYTSHQRTMQREQEQAATQHQYLASTLQNRVVYERLSQKRPLLSATQVDELLDTLLVSQSTADSGIAIWRGKSMVSQLQAAPLTDAFRTAVNKSKDSAVQMTVTTHKQHTYILAGAPLALEGNTYALFTVTDISDVYDTLEQQRQFVRVVSLVFACLIGGVLILFVLRLMAPLHRIHNTLHCIADGDYSLRLPEKGGQEFRTLSRSINQMADAIELHIQQAEGLAESRKVFIDNLAHEMKTPLTSILGFADILRIKREVSDEQRQEYAGIIVDETKRLQALSGKLMELVTAGNVALDREEITAENLLADAARAMTPLLQRRQMTLRQEAEADIVLSVDKPLFTSLLYNLMDNAAKASQDGQEIALTCCRAPDGVRLAVRDHGIGMSADSIAKVTEPFYMVDKSRSRKAGGAGLGLALCAEIAKRHGAALLIDSQPGEGTTVTILFPNRKKGAVV